MSRLLLSSLLLTCACITVNVGGGGEPASVYAVDSPAPPAGEGGWGCVVRIRDFRCVTAYDRTDMVLQGTDGLLTISSGNRWSASPGSLLGDLLARDLLASGGPDAVLRRTSAGGGDIVVECFVSRFGAVQDRDGSWSASLESDVMMLDASADSILLQKVYSYDISMPPGGEFAELARAMGEAAGSWSADIRADMRAIASLLQAARQED